MYLKSINVTLNQHFRISEGSCDAKKDAKELTDGFNVAITETKDILK